jgi:hypothetical protein
MKTVRAKFTCSAVMPNAYGGGITAHFHSVYSADGENADFVKATPYANLNIMIYGDAPASKFFKQGKDYYLDFAEVKK